MSLEPRTMSTTLWEKGERLESVKGERSCELKYTEGGDKVETSQLLDSQPCPPAGASPRTRFELASLQNGFLALRAGIAPGNRVFLDKLLTPALSHRSINLPRLESHSFERKSVIRPSAGFEASAVEMTQRSRAHESSTSSNQTPTRTTL